MKKWLSIFLSVLFLLTALPLGMVSVAAKATSAEQVDLEEVFRSNLNFLDQYYELGPEFMANKLCGILYDWEAAEANDYADQPMPAAEFEEILYRYFAPTVDLLADLRSYQLYEWETNSYYPFYNAETDTYNIFFVGGFGGDMPVREYMGYVKTDNGYTVYYQHVTYEYLPDMPEIYAELEALNWPFTYTYDGKEYENSPDGYLRVASRDDYGNKYEVQYNDGILRILSQAPYTAAPESDFEYDIIDGEVTITGYRAREVDLVIPSTIEGYPVTKIGDQAFWGCDFIASVMVPEGVTYIGDCSFIICYGLKGIWLPSTVTYVHPWAFQACYGLRGITVQEDNAAYCSVNGVLYDKEMTTLVCYPLSGADTYVIPDGVVAIGEAAFYDNHYIMALTIPTSLKMVGDWSFNAASRLTVYYGGSEADRAAMDLGGENPYLENAVWYYNWMPVTSGDANVDGKVNAQDLAVMARYINGWDVEIDIEAGDVSGDDQVNVRDLGILQRYLNGWDVELK